jgi:hypothetical protein
VQVSVIGAVGFEGRKMLQTQLSAGRIMAGVLWDSEGILHVDFLPHDVSVNAQYCSNLLLNDMH